VVNKKKQLHHFCFHVLTIDIFETVLN